MPTTSPSHPDLITTLPGLKSLAGILADQPLIAVDTESNSLYAYREQVCLIQFSTPQSDYLVDPLALSDLSPLGEIFHDPGIEKVFHAAEYDLICLKRDFAFEFNNLFDTMVAARILGRPALGLGAMLESEFGVKLDKHYQRANWGQRPLPNDLLAYARLDTHYLIALRQRLSDALRIAGLDLLAAEDFNHLTQISGNATEDKNGLCWRISGAYELQPTQAALLFELCRYRDQAAHSLNRPLFKVISDQALISIACAAPLTLGDLRRLNTLSPHQIQRHGAGLLKAVQRGLQAEPLYPPRLQRPNGQYLERLESLRGWRKRTAQQMGVNSDVVLPRDLLLALAERNPAGPAELSQAMQDFPWRLEHFGPQILRALE